jgi:hypothetical protein
LTGRIRLLTAVIVVLLAGDGVGLAVVSDRGRSGGSGPPAAQAAAIRRVVPDIERFVERERGLTFNVPVKVELLGDKAFVKRLRGDGKQDTEALAKAEGFLQALDLIDGDVRLGPAVDRLLSSAVAGFYDPKSKALVVRGAEPTPSVRAVLAHELTHALQDQHFGLERPALDERTDEAPSGFTGLVEGDAVRIQQRYFQSLSADERAAFLAEEGSSGPPTGVPSVLVDVLLFPYRTGPELVEAILRDGGQPRLDAAFASPPETSEHLLHPAVYLRGEGPRAVTVPRADGTVFDRGVVGEFGLRLLFRNLGSVGRRGAEGWGGDRYVAWRSNGRPCVRARFVMDTPKDITELTTALRRWASDHDDATVTPADGAVTLTSCA